jgi:hypothetical protein
MTNIKFDKYNKLKIKLYSHNFNHDYPIGSNVRYKCYRKIKGISSSQKTKEPIDFLLFTFILEIIKEVY